MNENTYIFSVLIYFMHPFKGKIQLNPFYDHLLLLPDRDNKLGHIKVVFIQFFLLTEVLWIITLFFCEVSTPALVDGFLFVFERQQVYSNDSSQYSGRY